ncbi:MAG: hypothetical protein HGB20_05280 [Chlorobiaceae bacterium]|nr:hypothetical protein [Chlorobiaceae bacterium]
MVKSRCNIACRIWRSFEILLFFVISVVGVNVFFKTSSQNSRSKEKSQSGNVVARCEQSGPELTFNGTLVRLRSYLSLQHRDNSAHRLSQAIPAFPVAIHQYHPTVPRYSPISGKTCIYPYSPAPFQPANLLQQNPVLLI